MTELTISGVDEDNETEEYEVIEQLGDTKEENTKEERSVQEIISAGVQIVDGRLSEKEKSKLAVVAIGSYILTLGLGIGVGFIIGR